MTTSSKQDVPAIDATGYERNLLLRLFETMVRIREFEEGVKYLFLEGSMPGTIINARGRRPPPPAYAPR